MENAENETFPINLYYYKFNVLVRKIEIQKDLNLFF